MTNVRVSAVAFLAFVLSGQLLVAESPFRYREYTLESSVAAVLKISGQRESRNEDAAPATREHSGARMAGALRAGRSRAGRSGA